MKAMIIKYRELEWWEERLSGKLNNKIYYQRNGKTFIQKLPCKYDHTPTLKQEVARQRFKQAQQFAVSVINDPDMKSQYEKKAGGKITAYAMAISEYMRSH